MTVQSGKKPSATATKTNRRKMTQPRNNKGAGLSQTQLLEMYHLLLKCRLVDERAAARLPHGRGGFFGRSLVGAVVHHDVSALGGHA